MEALSLQQEPATHAQSLTGVLAGKVKVQSFQVSSRQFDHFESISNALNRLDQGTYGRCVICGSRIPADVLARTPWAVECRGCGDQERQP